MAQNPEVASQSSGSVIAEIGVIEPPDVRGINPTELPVGSSDTWITVNGVGFGTYFQGLVSGQARSSQWLDSGSLSVLVTAADLAKTGQLPIAVRSTQTSYQTASPTPLTVK